ncbi:YlmH family RNA-binding protein [Lutispora thermophila]|uniref:RNA-binding protein YlmH, contains S4-like domain n=1 Tax=Lutispora thermophila DSM 19022 TaxID=1122184 RepID=A0A1M6G2E7_9FIRM|nr:YlmH/Sll1252 family protein [Lutispora thermophila]SHJ04032.1 RNA-binding protein YlmH, contains S4-like domain [Lutispora thermophila DSM 19022]
MEDVKSKYADELLIRRLEDLIEKTDKSMTESYTDFLDPRQQALISDSFKHVKGISMEFYGGYEEAERKICGIFNEYDGFNKNAFPISFLHICWKSPKKVSHRDILGSILGTGIRRDKVGDIIQKDQEAYVCVHKDIVDYLIMSIDKVGSATVHIEHCYILPELSKECKILYATIASLRLDAVVAAGFGVSRTRAVEAIRSSKVFVNWKPEISSSKDIKEGDVISWRGKGRIQLSNVVGSTKKDRVKVAIKKYI